MPKKVIEPIEEEFEEELEDEFEEEPVNPDFAKSLTVAVPIEEKDDDVPRVTVFLPKLIDDDSGVKVDQYEHVTIANEQGEEVTYVLRGEYVDVTIPVFIALKQKYPKL